MGLIKRINTLFKADMHALVDQLEDPVATLKQSIREMKHLLSEMKAQQVAQQKQLKGLNQRRAYLEEALEKFTQEMTLCLSAGNENLARHLVRRKLNAEQNLAKVRDELHLLTQVLTETSARINDQSERLATLQAEAAHVISSAPDASATDATPGDAQTLDSVSEADVEIALLRELQSRNLTRQQAFGPSTGAKS